MTHFTTRRGLVPCLGTPCNEVGYCPSLELPAKSWNAVIQLMKLKRGMGSKFTLYCQLTPGCAAECVTFTQWVDAVLQMVALTGLSQIIPLRRILGQDIWFTSPHYWPKTPMGLPLRELSKWLRTQLLNSSQAWQTLSLLAVSSACIVSQSPKDWL